LGGGVMADRVANFAIVWYQTMYISTRNKSDVYCHLEMVCRLTAILLFLQLLVL